MFGKIKSDDPKIVDAIKKLNNIIKFNNQNENEQLINVFKLGKYCEIAF